MKISNFTIDENSKTFIIAELSGNHKGSINRAFEIIKAAKDAGADACKLQTYTPDSITLDSNDKLFKLDDNSLWKGHTLYSLYKVASTPYEWHKELKDYAESLGLILFSSPFDTDAVDFLEELDMPCYKIASFEINDIHLIRYTASKQKPMLISTGLATLQDIETAVNVCKLEGNNNIILLKCTSEYPTPIDEVNLNLIKDMRERFNLQVGLSDHTLGDLVAVASIPLGVKVIEKHLTLDDEDTVDSAFSMRPLEFKIMVDKIRMVERALGIADYTLSPNMKSKLIERRSLFSSKDIKKGDIFSKDNIRSIRPANGLNTKYYSDILGKKAKVDIKFATPLSCDMID